MPQVDFLEAFAFHAAAPSGVDVLAWWKHRILGSVCFEKLYNKRSSRVSGKHPTEPCWERLRVEKHGSTEHSSGLGRPTMSREDRRWTRDTPPYRLEKPTELVTIVLTLLGHMTTVPRGATATDDVGLIATAFGESPRFVSDVDSELFGRRFFP
jgi:hypothetical protein